MTKYLAVDTETTGLFVDDGCVCKVISICGENGSRVFILDEMTESQIKKLYDKLKEHRIIYHNAKFDLHMLNTGYGCDLEDNFHWDTQLAIRILDPGKTTALKWYCANVFGFETIKAMQEMDQWLTDHKMKKDKMWTAPRDVLIQYAAADAELTWRLYHYQLEQLIHSDNELEDSRLIQREFSTMRTLYRMEKRGIGWDVETATKASVKLNARIEKLAKQLPFRPTVPQAVKYFYEDQGYIPTDLTAKGKPSIGKSARRTLIEQGAKWAQEYDLYERTKRWVSMWYEGWTTKCGPDGRLRTSFRQQGTVSMRFSVERVQLQAIPHDYQMQADLPKGVPTPRMLFRAKEGHQLWEIDVSQAEVRIATAVARCERMREIIERGDDIHDATCTEIFGYKPNDPEWKRYRNIAKRLNFAMVYGAGVRGLQEQIRIHAGVVVPEGEARSYLDVHRKTFPEFVRAAQSAEQRAQQRGHVRLCSGMKRWFARDEELSKAFNQVIQGGVAEAMKDWMMVVESNWRDTLLLQIHDSLIVELPEVDDAQVQAEEIARRGEKVFEHYFKIPFVAEAKQWV